MNGFHLAFGIFGLFVVLFIGTVLVAIIVAVTRASRQRRADSAAPEVSARAVIIDKRIATSGGGETSVTQQHYVSFQQAGGERFELEVPAGEYGLLVVGDSGAVTMKGTRYLGFEREIMR